MWYKYLDILNKMDVSVGLLSPSNPITRNKAGLAARADQILHSRNEKWDPYLLNQDWALHEHSGFVASTFLQRSHG